MSIENGIELFGCGFGLLLVAALVTTIVKGKMESLFLFFLELLVWFISIISFKKIGAGEDWDEGYE